MDLDKKIVINMLSSADKVEGQGVGSAYLEQVNLVKEGASDLFTVEINSGKKADIIHSHTIDPQNYLKMKNNKSAFSTGYAEWEYPVTQGTVFGV